MKRVAINGFGRIGRAFLRIAYSKPDLEIVAINDVALKPDVAAYLLQYDSVYRRFPAGEAMTKRFTDWRPAD